MFRIDWRRIWSERYRCCDKGDEILNVVLMKRGDVKEGKLELIKGEKVIREEKIKEEKEERRRDDG
jgi:hypothetical protein